jgi:MoxR-like ATPase
MAHQRIGDFARLVVSEVEKAIVGKREAVEMSVVSLLCEGHLLIEDVPGVGKTTLARAMAKTIGGEFRRVQFTPDLLPADVTGSSVYNQKQAEFEFRAGPIFANVVLADEINRATPKTQSALLEAMEEGTVSTDGETRRLPRPFFVIATQNSVEMTGTYPLPEAQLDRFFARISLGYPDREAEREVLNAQQLAHPLETLSAVATIEELQDIQRDIRTVFVHDAIKDYIVDIVRATRSSNQLILGASPRATLHFMRAAQAKAAIAGASSVRPDDVKEVSPYILGHRVMPRAEFRAKGIDSAEIIRQVTNTVPTPLPVS